MSCLLLRITISRAFLVILPHVSTQLGAVSKLLVTTLARVDAAPGVVSHVNAQLVIIEERFVTLGACVLLLLVLL